MYTKVQNTMLLIARIIIAAIFGVAAYYKFPFWSMTVETSQMPAWLFYVMLLLSVAEPIGALAVLVGFLTRWAALGLTIIMIGAIFVSKFMMGMGFVTQTGAGWNFPLVVIAALVLLYAFGAGAWSIDAKMKKA